MKKTKLKPEALLPPMPAVIVGSKNDDTKPNFTTIAWAGVVNSDPPMVSVAFRKSRYGHELMSKSRVFSVNIPSSRQAVETDYCGIISGRGHRPCL